MPGYAQDPAAGAFAQSRTCYEEMEQWLGSAEAAELTHGELEEQLGSRGRELLRLMMQDLLDLRAMREQRRDDVVADGVPRTRAEKGHDRPLATVFGEVTVTRMAYRAPRAANAYPADAELNLPAEKHSHGLRKLATAEAPRGSYQDAAAAITRATGVTIGKRQSEQLAVRAGVYGCVPVPRAPQDIITPPGKDKPAARADRPKASGKWLTASVTDDIPAVIADAFDEAERRDPEHKRTWIALVDGNSTQIEAIRAEAARRGVTVTIVCDLVHVLHLSTVRLVRAMFSQVISLLRLMRRYFVVEGCRFGPRRVSSRRSSRFSPWACSSAARRAAVSLRCCFFRWVIWLVSAWMIVLSLPAPSGGGGFGRAWSRRRSIRARRSVFP